MKQPEYTKSKKELTVIDIREISAICVASLMDVLSKYAVPSPDLAKDPDYKSYMQDTEFQLMGAMDQVIKGLSDNFSIKISK
jgi:hypothetical protein